MEKDGHTFDIILETSFQQLRLKYIHKNDWEIFHRNCSSVFTSLGRRSLPTVPNTGADVKKMYIFLRDLVLALEERFDEVICFPNDKIQEEFILCTSRQTPPDITTEKQWMLQEKLMEILEEYSRRNILIQEQEMEGVNKTLNFLMPFYKEANQNDIGRKFLNQTTLDEILTKNYQKFLEMFLQACDFKDRYWVNHYTQMLKNRVSNEDRIISKNHFTNQKFLEEDLGKILDSCNLNYMKLTKTRLAKPVESTSSPTMDSSLLEDALCYFDSQVSSRIGNQHSETIEKWKNLLKISFTKMSQQMECEVVDRNLRNQEKMRFRKCRPILVRPTPSMEFSKLARYLIVHMGLRNTRTAVFRTNSSALKIYDAEENWSFFTSNLNILSKDLGREACFLGSFLGKPVDGRYKVEIKGSQYSYKFQDFVSFRLKDLKTKAESKCQRDLRECIICVPQCLNQAQRKSIEDGAGSAGFEKVELIGDTNAIALGYIRESKIFTGKIVAANVKGGSFDVAWFTANDGSICCDAVSGDYFVDRPHGGFLWSRRNVSQMDLFQKTNQVLAKEWGQEAKDAFILCGGNRIYDKIIKNYFPTLRTCMTAVDEEYPIRGAAQLALLDHKIEKVSGLDLSKFRQLKESIVCELTKNHTKSSNIPRDCKLLPATVEGRRT